MSGAPRRVVVIGGGVIGASCAYYLSRSDWAVTIVDRGEFGKACSHGNCGYVCPSHVLPLAMPGAIVDAVRAMCRANSPFSIKPRLDLSLWTWLLQFARRCTTAKMLDAGLAIHALLRSSRSLYDELFATESLECEWEPRGLLFVFRSRHAFEHYAATERLLRERFGLTATRHNGEALSALEPALRRGLAGGWYFRSDGHLRPDRLMASWRRLLGARGVRVVEQCEVTDFRRVGETAGAAITSQGDIPAEAFVVATGAWTPFLNCVLGCRIPIQPGKGYSITMPRPVNSPTLPLIFEEDRVAVTPMRSGIRIGSMMEFAGYDTTLHSRRLDVLHATARRYLTEAIAGPVDEEWYGWRPMTPDSVPVIDRSNAFSNVLIAAGHNMLGVSMAPATGKLVAEMLGGVPHLDIRPYRHSRFRGVF